MIAKSVLDGLMGQSKQLVGSISKANENGDTNDEQIVSVNIYL